MGGVYRRLFRLPTRLCQGGGFGYGKYAGRVLADVFINGASVEKA